jgi:hypothetical protein
MKPGLHFLIKFFKRNGSLIDGLISSHVNQRCGVAQWHVVDLKGGVECGVCLLWKWRVENLHRRLRLWEPF